MTQSRHLATKIPSSHLIGSGTVAQVLEALQNDGVPSRLVALGDPGCEHVLKVIHNLPVPSRAALINAAVKCRFCQSKLPFHRRERTRRCCHTLQSC